MALEIAESNPNEPARVIVYGPEGMGKSTFGARAPNPIFVAAENGVSRLKDRNGKPVKYFKGIASFEDVLGSIKKLRNDKHEFQSMVLDSATATEKFAHKKVIGTSGKSIITVDKGFGAGAAKSDSFHLELVAAIEDLRIQRNMHIIITAHSRVKTVKDPAALEDYDQFEMALEKGVAGIWRQYVDAQLFVRLETHLKTGEEQRARALTTDKRIVYAQKDPAFEAKNRFGMPKALYFTENFWDEFMTYVESGVDTEEPGTPHVYLSSGDDKMVATEPLPKSTPIASPMDAGLNEEVATLQSRLIENCSKISDEDKKKQVFEYVSSIGNDLNALRAADERLNEILNEQQTGAEAV